jgi:hypothetical protein
MTLRYSVTVEFGLGFAAWDADAMVPTTMAMMLRENFKDTSDGPSSEKESTFCGFWEGQSRDKCRTKVEGVSLMPAAGARSGSHSEFIQENRL